MAQCIKENKILETLPLAEYKKHSDLFESDLFDEISLETCVNKRISKGGTSVKSVEEQIEAVKEKIK